MYEDSVTPISAHHFQLLDSSEKYEKIAMKVFGCKVFGCKVSLICGMK